ncbi:hypothetical protein Bdiaspc4_33030 [Bradyrhizobium diazoefficiens]|nr:hypothetical protein CO678_37375 [Bradyrhizobium diazoefficiens]QBP25020.1 hypothetical protein Bdiaspc4_33030 [Bradyrhizobium diazoefficiens]
MDTGSREENASKQESGAPFRFHRNGAPTEPLRRSAGWNGDRRSCQCRFPPVPSAGAKPNKEN